jgi:hypothetical protein
MRTVLFRSFAACTLVVTLITPIPGLAWGNEGHRLINKLAASNLPSDVPAFLRSEAAIGEIEYLGPEPDRWRSRAEPELEATQAPEHFLDLEPADALGPLPRKRLDFEAVVFAHGQRPEKIGLQPWETIEVWQRLKAALREYRRIIRKASQPPTAFTGVSKAHSSAPISRKQTSPLGCRRPSWSIATFSTATSLIYATPPP